MSKRIQYIIWDCFSSNESLVNVIKETHKWRYFPLLFTSHLTHNAISYFSSFMASTEMDVSFLNRTSFYLLFSKKLKMVVVDSSSLFSFLGGRNPKKTLWFYTCDTSNPIFSNVTSNPTFSLLCRTFENYETLENISEVLFDTIIKVWDLEWHIKKYRF